MGADLRPDGCHSGAFGEVLAGRPICIGSDTIRGLRITNVGSLEVDVTNHTQNTVGLRSGDISKHSSYVPPKSFPTTNSFLCLRTLGDSVDTHPLT